MSELSDGESPPWRLIDYLTLIATAPVAALGALGVSRVLRPTFCTLNQQVRVWGFAFLLFLALMGFALAKRRYKDTRAAFRRTLVAVAALALLLSLWLPNLFGAVSRSRQKGTMSDLRAISGGVEAARSQSGVFPTLSSVAELEALVGKPLPERDRWGNSFVLRCEPTRYVVVSFGECGEPEQHDPWSYRPGPTYDIRADIVHLNGKPWRYPEGVQHD